MNGDPKNWIVQIMGRDCFEWLSGAFNKETRLKDIPYEILEAIGSVDITIRDYAADRNAVISIALITFAYRMVDKVQHPKNGSNDILLLKVLAKNEESRRRGKKLSNNKFWDAPT